MTPTVLLIGTLDTKGAEYAYLRERLRLDGIDAILIDVGTLGRPTVEPDISREDVAARAGVDLDALAAGHDRGAAVTAMADAAAATALHLRSEGRCDAVLAAGGSGNSAIASAAMRVLPVGLPKVLVSTMASGDVSAYVGGSDIVMMPAVTDVAGLNSISRRILANAAAATAGMLRAPDVEAAGDKTLIAATMFGVTTAAVTVAREELERRGYEVLVFHATGAGGQAMEALVRSGFVAGVLDLTTTELCDDLVGGVLSAGPDRLEAAGRAGIPQVVSVGALDMVNFGPADTVPPRFADRNLLVHNPTVTLMRTTPAENAELGRRIGAKLSAATGPVSLFLPLRGVSAVDVEGGPFFDPDADAALFAALRESTGPNVVVHQLDTDINSAEFALAMVDELDARLDGAS